MNFDLLQFLFCSMIITSTLPVCVLHLCLFLHSVVSHEYILPFEQPRSQENFEEERALERG